MDKIAINDLISLIKDNKDLEYFENYDLKNSCTFRIGGKARLVIKPYSQKSLISILNILSNTDIKFRVFGNCSNILFDDSGFNGCIILTNKIKDISLYGTKLFVGCGCSINHIAEFALNNSLSGFEKLYGIPGTLGGAVFMNAGAFNKQISDLMSFCNVYDIESNQLLTLTNEDMNFSYRHSILHDNNNYIFIGGTLCLKQGDFANIKNEMFSIFKKRKTTQPLDFPSAGSVFKRPEGFYAGKLIEDSGLKGYSIGGAQISEKHAGFIINKSNATSSDVLKLINYAKDTVNKNFNVKLSEEIEYIKYE